jgi:GntR family transcriptional regulator, transcriptional repressor for pyruvate dehydrogenase complex
VTVSSTAVTTKRPASDGSGRSLGSDEREQAIDLQELVTDLGHGRPTHEIIADALHRRIALGGYEPGQSLPAERELAVTLGIGRATLRAALRRLQQEGLVSTRPGRTGGTTVLAAGRDTRTGGWVGAERERQLYDVGDVRAVLEPLSARRATENISADEAAALELLAGQPAAGVEAFTTLDTRFHIAVAAATGNPLLRSLIERAREDFFDWANALWFRMDLRERNDLGAVLDNSLAEHRPIAAAIAAGDARRAERLMVTHIRAGVDGYAEILLRARRRSRRDREAPVR